MTRVQVVYASRHGGTEGIATRIADVLRARGDEVVTKDAAKNPVSEGFDAYVVGSGVYLGKWLPEGIAFVEHNLRVLAAKPVWLFSSGPVGEGKVSDDPGEALEAALGPATGPGDPTFGPRSYMINGWNDYYRVTLSESQWKKFEQLSWDFGMPESSVPLPSAR